MNRQTFVLAVVLLTCSTAISEAQDKVAEPTPEAVRRVDAAYARVGATPVQTRNIYTGKAEHVYQLPATTTDDDLEKLPASPFPFGLSLDGTKVTNKGLSKLKGLDTLNNLILPSKFLTDEGLAALKSAGLVHALPDAIGKDNSRPKSAKEVRLLNLWYHPITAHGLRYLEDLTNLNELLVPENAETDDMLRTLRKIGLLHAWRNATAKDGQRPSGPKDVVKVKLPGKVADAGLKELQVFANLESLWLDSSAVTPAGLLNLKGLTKLNDLRLHDQQLTDQAVVNLQQIGLLHAMDRVWTEDRKAQWGRRSATKPEEVTHVHWGSNSLHMGDEAVGALQTFSHLRSLKLYAPKMTSTAVEKLAAFKELTELSLFGINLTDNAVKAIAKLTELTTLRVEGITAEQLRHLEGLKKLTTLDCHHPTDAKLRALREVGLLHTLPNARTKSQFGYEQRPLKPEDVYQFSLEPNEHLTPTGLRELSVFKNLRELELPRRNYGITDDMLKALREAGLLHTMKDVTVIERYRSIGGGQSVLDRWRPKDMESVKLVELVQSNVTEEGLKELLPLKNLEQLLVGSDKLTGAGLKHLEGLKSLRALHLTGEKLSTDGLGQLRLFPQLTELTVGHCELSVDGIKAITVLENLKTLRLDRVRITEAGAKELTRLKGNPTLKLLVRGDPAPVLKGLQGVKGLTLLSLLEVPEQSLKEQSFKDLSTLTSLTKLFLGGICISDDGLKQLQTLKNLQGLEFDGGKATPGGIQAFRSAVPGCRLYIDE